MRLLTRTLPLALSFSLGILPGAFSQAANQQDRVVAGLEGAAPVRIAGHLPVWDKPAGDLGQVADALPVHLTVGIARDAAVQAAFEQRLKDQQTPGSPYYHQWLTPQQVGQQFGPTQHDLDAMTAYLAGSGLNVESVSPSRTQIEIATTAGNIAAAFGTTLHSFRLGSDKVRGPVSEPQVPAALAPIVSYIGGLVDVPMHPTGTAHVLAQIPGQSPGQAAPAFTTSSGTHYQFPGDFNIIYDSTPALANGFTGTGQKIAILSGSRMLAADLTNFESLAGLASYTPNYIVVPGQTDPGTLSDGNQDEATLDFIRSYGTAPGAQIDYLLAQGALYTSVTNQMLSYEINTLKDPILSLSFGLCENVAGAAFTRNEDSLFSQAAAQGISVFVSSGDAGVAGCETQGGQASANQIASINTFCASSYVTCVGGTQFSDLTSPSTYWSSTNNSTTRASALSYIPEGAMNEPTYTNSSGVTSYVIFATGGGPSTVIAKPSWQTATGVPADGFRDTPDISFSGSQHDGYIGCLAHLGASCAGTQGAVVFSGTSASAPSMAGVAALLNQKLGMAQGNLNPTLYKLYASTPNAFHDATPATSGVSNCTTATPSTCNNSTPGQTSLTGGLAGYPLTTGYDLSTGLGSLDINAFLSAAGLPTPTGTLTASATSITIGQTVTFTAALTGTSGNPTGTVQFFSNGTALTTVTLTNGSATTVPLSFPLAGTYAITAVYSGNTTYGSVTLSGVTLTVTNPAAVASTTTLTVTPASGTTAQTYVFTARVAPATTNSTVPTGSVQFAVDGASAGTAVTLSGGVATYSPAALAAGPHTVTCAYSGDSTYAASTCNTVTVTVTALASSTSITISPAITPQVGQVTFSTTVTGLAGAAVPSGTVTLYQGTTSVGSLTLSGGTASGTITGTSSSPFNAGIFPFNWSYSGDTVYAASTSAVANLTITGISLTPNPSSLTLTRGQTGTSTLTYASINGFTGSQTSTCTVVSQVAVTSLPVCSVAATSFSVAANATATAVLTVTTTAPRSATRDGQWPLPGRELLGGTALAALFFTMAPGRRRRLRALARGRLVLLPLALLLGAGLLAASGCGSGGSTGTSPTTGTSLGNYTVVVTSSVQSSTSPGSQASVSVVVQ